MEKENKWICVEDIKSEIKGRMYFNEFHIKEYKKLENPTPYEKLEYHEECAQYQAYASLLPYIDDFSFTLGEIMELEKQKI